jgi:hypothetical protein
MTNSEIIRAIEIAVAKAMAAQKVTNGPAERDAPNAPMPDDAIAGGLPQHELAAWRAPSELRGGTIHTAAGMMQVPGHGVVHTRATDDHEDKCDCAGCAVNKELRGRGFRRMQAKKSAVELVGDQIKEVLAGGTARGRAMDLLRNADRSGAVAAQAGGDVMRWLSKRNEANFPQPEMTRWTPRDCYIERLMAKGYSRAESERIANGDEA